MSDDQRPERGFQNIADIIGGFSPQEIMAVPEPVAPDELAKETGQKKIRQPNAKLAEAAAEIVARPPDKDRDEIAYICRELVQCAFPIRDPGPVPSWRRHNGNITLIIQPGIDPETGELLRLPSGEFPRLAMPFFQKQVVMRRSPNIKLGTTRNDFIRATGGDPNTGRGKRGDAKRTMESFRCLIYSRITFRYAEGTAQKGREAFANMEVGKSGHLWWDFKNPEQGSFFESEIVLGDLLFQAFLHDPIPVDFRALLALKKSLKQASFAMDIYNWGQSQLYQMRKQGEVERRIKYKYLPEQFGAEFGRLRDWKAAFEENAFHVQQVLPSFEPAFDGEYFVVNDLEGRLAVPAHDKAIARRQLAQLQPYNQISQKTREWFQDRYPFQRVEEAFADFDGWRQRKGIESRDTNAHFIHFVENNWIKK